MQDELNREPGGNAPPNNPVDAQWWKDKFEKHRNQEITADAMRAEAGMPAHPEPVESQVCSGQTARWRALRPYIRLGSVCSSS